MVTVGDKVEKALLRAALEHEREIDDALEKMQKTQEMREQEKEDDIEEIRRKRLEQMKEEHRRKQDKISSGHGTYDELFDEKSFFGVAKECERLVVHFYRPSTWRCDIVDKHFRELSRKHWNTRFVKIDAEKCKYLSEKLHIWVLPSVVCVKDAKTEHTICGFSELSGDEHTTEEYEKLLAKWQMVDLEE